MVSSLNSNVMMEILLMEMVAAALAQKRKDGSVVEAHPITPVSVRNSLLIKFNYQQKEL